MAEDPKKGDAVGSGVGDREREEEQVVNPWEVTAKDGGKIDYDKLIEKFGCQRLEESLVRRVERLTGHPAHVFLRRVVFFAHRSGSFFALLISGSFRSFGAVLEVMLLIGWFWVGTSMRYLMSMRGARSSTSTRAEGLPLRHYIWGIWCPSCSLSRYHCLYQYTDCPLPGGTAKIDRRRSISAVGGRLREKSTVGGRLREKKKEEEKRRKKYLLSRAALARLLLSPAGRSCAVAALARGSLARCRHP
ncbi:hypothetical protein BHM03_00051490, partial [Ensete ventricosum]